MIKEIDQLLCIGCGVCETVCPADVIRISTTTGKAIAAYKGDCWTCYNCELDCPVGAIKVAPFRRHRPPMSFSLDESLSMRVSQ